MSSIRGLVILGSLLALLLGCIAQQTDIVGSGTTLMTNEMQRAINMLQVESRPSISMSYRSIGSFASETEITASLSLPVTNTSNFAVLGFNLNASNYNSIKTAQSAPLQIPIAILKTSLINSVPSSMTSSSAINLTDCALAGIYAGTITTWTDPQIVKNNPYLTVPAGQPITVVGRTDTSSTAMSLTTYLARACPSVWTYGSLRQRPVSSWPAKNTVTVITSDDMLLTVSSTNFSIGFVSEALLIEFTTNIVGTGISECALQVGGSWNTSSGSLESSVSQIIPVGSYPAINADWSNTSFISAPAVLNGWALTVPIILVVPSNATSLGSTSGLLSAWINFLLSPACQMIFSGTGQSALSNATLVDLLSQVNKNLILSPDANPWTFELSGNSSSTGGSNYVFSQFRSSFDTYNIEEFDLRLAELEAQLEAANKMIQSLLLQTASASAAVAALAQNNTIRLAALEVVAAQAAQDRARLNNTILDVSSAESQATKAAQIAIGGVILAAILAVVALILAAVYVARTKRLDQKYSKYLPLGVKARFGDSADGL